MNSGAFFCACVMDCLVLCVYGGGMVFFFVGFWLGIWIGAFIISNLMISFMFEFTVVCKAQEDPISRFISKYLLRYVIV
jgi:hypothetical protein